MAKPGRLPRVWCTTCGQHRPVIELRDGYVVWRKHPVRPGHREVCDGSRRQVPPDVGLVQP